MSQENVEIVLALHEAFNRGDLDGLVSKWSPECEYRAAITQVVEGEAGVFRGHDGLRRWWEELRYLYDELSSEVLEVRGTETRSWSCSSSAGEGRAVASSSKGRSCPRSSRCGKGRSPMYATTSTGTRPSKPWGGRSKTFTPIPEAETHRLTSGRGGRSTSP